MVLALALALGLPVAVASSSASELTVSLEADRTSPQTGEPVLFTATASEPDVEYEFRVDGGPPETPDQGEPGRFTRAFSASGQHTVTVRVSNESLDEATDSVTVTAVDELRAAVRQKTEHPGAPYTGEPVTFEASATGGRQPISYRWDYGADGSIDATGPTVTRTFSESGPNRTRLHAGDAASPQHSDVVDVVTRVAPGSRPPACVNELRWGLAEIKTTGCFERPPSGRNWVVGDAGVDLNGIPIRPESGRTIYIEEPSSDHPAGRITSSLAAILAGDAVLYRAPLDLSLPDGGPGEAASVAALKAYRLARLFYLTVRGSFVIRLKRAADGAYSSEIRATIQLPEPIRDAPPKLRGGDPTPRPVTNETTLHFSGDGLRYENVRLHTPSAWYLAIPLGEVCWAYAGAGDPDRPCPAFTLDDEPYLECNSPVTTNRWDGTVRLTLPTTNQAVMGAFTSVSAGEVVAVGAARDNFAGPLLSLDLIDFWGLNRLAFGLCRENPVQVRGDIGIAVLPNRFTTHPLEIDGRWTYTAPHKILGVRIPWTLVLSGKARVFRQKVGTANVVKMAHFSSFNIQSDLNFRDVIRVEGGLSGWIDARENKFAVEGRQIRACIETLCAPGARGIVSSRGLGACIDVGKVKLFGKTIRIRAGAGAEWSNPTKIRLVDGRCGFKRYRKGAARAASGHDTFVVTKDAPAVAVRIAGTSGPPKVRVTGPEFDVSSPPDESGTLQEGSFALIEDRGEGVTHLILVNRRPGTYTVTALDPDNAVTSIDTAAPERPFAARASVKRKRRGRHVLRMRYHKPVGSTLTLVERGEGAMRILAEDVRGRSCGRRLCATLRFRPAKGPGGPRRIQAVLERDGMPMETRRVTTYRAAGTKRPSRTRLRVRRRGSKVRIAWTRARRAKNYVVLARLSDGRRLSFRPGRRCRTVAVRGVPRDVRVRARVAGMDEELRAGRYARATLRPKKRHAGKRKVRLRRACE